MEGNESIMQKVPPGWYEITISSKIADEGSHALDVCFLCIFLSLFPSPFLGCTSPSLGKLCIFVRALF